MCRQVIIEVPSRTLVVRQFFFIVIIGFTNYNLNIIPDRMFSVVEILAEEEYEHKK